MDAINDVWIIGDMFLKESMETFNSMNRQARSNNQQPLHLFDMYNVKSYWPDATVTGLNRSITPLVDAFNDMGNQRLPKYIMVIPDKDVLNGLRTATGENFRVSRIIGALIHYIIKQIDLLIERRRQDLASKHTGALIDPEFPKTIWVRMLKRPKLDLPTTQEICVLRGKFNSILEERLHEDGRGKHYHEHR